MIYLLFNEGYSSSGSREAEARKPLADEAIRLVRLLLRLLPAEPEIMGLTALMLLQQARARPASTSDGNIVLLEDQDRSLWSQPRDRRRPGADRQGDAPPPARPLPGPGRHRRPACPRRRAEDTDWAQIDLLYANLERLQPSPVVTLNRAVAVSKVRGPEAALEMIEPLGERLQGYFYFHGVKGALLEQLERPGRSSRGLRPRDCAGQHPGRSGAHPPAPRPARRQKNSAADVGSAVGRSSSGYDLSQGDCHDRTAVQPPVLGGPCPYLSVDGAGKAADFYVEGVRGQGSRCACRPTRRAATCTSIS